MKRKKLLYMMLTLSIFAFLNIKNVSATDISLSAGETSLGSNSGNGSGGGNKSNSPIAYGYRVTFVDPTSGNSIKGHSHDYWGKGLMVYDNRYSIDGFRGDSSLFDWTFISGYDKYGNDQPIRYRYYDTKHNKTQNISGTGTDHYGKYNLTDASEDFLIPKYRDFLVQTTGCTNLKEENNVLLSFREQDKCHDNNYVKFAYYALGEAAEKNDYATYAKLLKDTNAVNTNGKTDIEIVISAREYVILVEPLTAIRTNDNSNTKSLNNYCCRWCMDI